MTPEWTALSMAQKIELVLSLTDGKRSAGQIAARIGVSRNAVIGVSHRAKRLGLTVLRSKPEEARTASRRRLQEGAIRARVTADKKARQNSVRATIDPVGRAKMPGRPRPSKKGIYSEDAIFSGPDWTPLPGTTPATLLDRTGCAWPVHLDGKQRTLFCDCPRHPGKPYCTTHMRTYSRTFMTTEPSNE